MRSFTTFLPALSVDATGARFPLGTAAFKKVPMSPAACRMLVACSAALWAGWCTAPAALAQSRPPTTEEIGKDPVARRQLEEQRRQGQQQPPRPQDTTYDDALRQQQARQQADVAQGQAVLRTWQQRPALAAANNPLLGRWQTQGNGQRAAGHGNDIMALAGAMIGGVTAGLCDSMLGSGLVEFRPAAVVAIGRDGKERTLYRAEYRGGGTRVAVLPQPGMSFTHMIVDLDRPGHASVAVVGCGLARVGATAAAAAAAPETALPWSLLGTSAANGGVDLYVARSAIERSGAIARMWDLWDFKVAQNFGGKHYLSVRNHSEYDCHRTRRRVIAMIGYAGHMGQGGVVEADNASQAWEQTPSGPMREFWNIACAKS
jgi:hypothetical protein